MQTLLEAGEFDSLAVPGTGWLKRQERLNEPEVYPSNGGSVKK